jgi:hypothetical protein
MLVRLLKYMCIFEISKKNLMIKDILLGGDDQLPLKYGIDFYRFYFYLNVFKSLKNKVQLDTNSD